MITAKPNNAKAGWFESELDDDLGYFMMPLKNDQLIAIQTQAPLVKPVGGKKKDKVADVNWISQMILRICLKDMRGIIDPDTQEPLMFTLKRENVTSGMSMELCQAEIFNKLPMEVLTEVLDLARTINGMSEDEAKAVNFTSDLSVATSTNPAETVTEIIASV